MQSSNTVNIGNGSSSGSSSGAVLTTTTPHTGTTLMLPSLVSGGVASAITVTPLTKEEAQELENLIEERNIAIKQAKINSFKSLAPELRQFVVSVLSWKDECEKISNVNVPKSARELELENKKQLNSLLGNFAGYSTTLNITNFGGYSANIDHGIFDITKLMPIPDGLTPEELKMAHLEATLEEQMLDETNP